MLAFHRSLLLAFIICFSVRVYAYDYSADDEAFTSYSYADEGVEYADDTERDAVIRGTLDDLESEYYQSSPVAAFVSENPPVLPTRVFYTSDDSDQTFFDQTDEHSKSFPLANPDRSRQAAMIEQKIWERTLSGADKPALTSFCKLGYLSGNTAYDFAHRTSELEYPFENWMFGSGVSVSVPQYRFNLRAQVMTTIETDAGNQMKDKDWITAGSGLEALGSVGELWSDTRSKAFMRGTIFDVSARYDLVYSSRDVQRFRGGLIGGYRYEKFAYEMYGLLYKRYLPFPLIEDQTIYPNTKVLGYQIQYYIPYMGFAFDIEDKRWGFGGSFSLAIHPTAEDRDDHILRQLVFFGDYKKKGRGFLCDIHGYYFLTPAWKFTVGLDITHIAIDGVTYDQTHDPLWDQDQSTDLKQSMFWTGLEYRF